MTTIVIKEETFGAKMPESSQKTSDDLFQSLPTWSRWLIKIGAVILGAVAMFLGVLTSISLSLCIFAGIILIISGFLVVLFEAPILFSFIDAVQPLTRFSQARPAWQKVILYTIPPIITLILCQSITSIFGSISLFLVAVIYYVVACQRSIH